MERDGASRDRRPAGPDGGADPDPAGDAGAEDAGGPSTALPPRLESWRRRSAAGAILTGFAMGLKEALEPQRQEPSIVMETSGDPPGDLPVEAEVDQIRPADNVVKIRPWLLADDEEDPPSP
ncbi:MAG TPA: hypothetical protein VKU91_04060 [Acidimicrobiales bacterium]|nr:hypothetical protein [Acidimicrobiales bacterium]